MGLISRFSNLFKAKTNTVLDKLEKPEEMLDYSFEKQRELLNRLRRDVAEVVTAKKRLEMQKAKLVANTNTLDDQARRALDSNREDLARLALERKNAILQQVASMDNQINDQYSSAEAQVRIKESVTGISEEMSDVGVSLNRAEEKAQKMQAKAQALDEMIDSGILTDYTTASGSGGGDIEAELGKVTLKSSVDDELKKLKAERIRKKNKEQVEGQEESEVVAQ